jgi:SAM-dependent methyltransferase
MARPTRAEIEALLRGEDVEDWLRLWEVSQGGATRRLRFERIAAVLPFAPGEAIDVLDLCCGPGDLGRAIHARYPRARLDALDRDPFLLAIGAEVDRRRRIPARVLEADAWAPGWDRELRGDYHVIAAATALHWFDEARLGELFADCRGRLRPGGLLVLAEPAAAEPELAPGLAGFAAREGSAFDIAATWDAFWSRAEALLGLDWRPRLEATPPGRRPIGDDGIPVLRWAALLRGAGFPRVDVVHREARTVTLAALRDPRRS